MASSRVIPQKPIRDSQEVPHFKEVYPNDPHRPHGSTEAQENDLKTQQERVEKEAQLRYEHLPDEEQEIVDSLLKGQIDLSDLPEVRSRIVRVFLSSTFTDMKEERNHLIANIYPKLRAYCRERHGVDFQAVDMRWGVPTYASDDHSVTDICLEEIQNCRKYSIGPNFVAFLGQKYGYIALPATVPRRLFEKIVANLKAIEHDVKQLKTWYKLDTNALDNVYHLQPISAVLGDETQKWTAVKEDLLNTFDKGLEEIDENDEEKICFHHQLHSSVTELEINEGISKVTKQRDRDNNCVIFTRRILEPDELLEQPNDILERCDAYRFFDLTDGTNELNSTKFVASQRLISDVVTPKVQQGNIYHDDVKWSHPKGIDPQVHETYLDGVGRFFHQRVRSLIDHNLAKQRRIQRDDLYEETLHHWHQVKRLEQTFVGRADLLEKIRHYLIRDTDKALVVHGLHGYGKSALLAKATSQVHEWMQRSGRNISTTVVVRFCGTSPLSSTIQQLLFHLCHQLAYTTDNYRSLVPKDFKSMKNYFKELVQNGEFRGMVVIVLDGLDQLSAEYLAHRLDWLPPRLSGNVKIIVSTSHNFNILQRLKSKIPDEEFFVQVEPLDASQCIVLINALLHKAKRMITFEQCKFVKEAISSSASPLYTKLIFEQVLQWKSYYKPDAQTLQPCVTACIETLFQKLEKRHGEKPVKYMLSYLTASRTGLSKPELNDILSIDDEVLDSMFCLWEPPIRRLPTNILPRIFHDISAYLTERETDETTVLYWYHEQFIVAATKKYLTDDRFKRHIHETMADYFRGIWSGTKAKKFTYSLEMQKRLNLNNPDSAAVRYVPEQPMVFDTFNTTTRYNYRKLNQQPLHMYHAAMYDQLHKEVFFNYQWLYTKIKACSVRQVISDLNMSTQHEVKLLTDVFRMSEAALAEDPNLLGLEITGRLLAHAKSCPNIRDLISQCDYESKMKCPLVPNWQVFTAPGGPLQYVCEADPNVREDVDIDTIQCDDIMLLIAKPYHGTKMRIWDVTNEEPLPDMVLPANSRVYPTPNGLFVNAFKTLKTNKFLQTYRLDSGDLCGEVEFNHANHNCTAISNKYMAFTLDNVASPIIIDLEAQATLQRFQYQSQVVALSNDDRYLLCNNGQMLNLHSLPLLERKIMISTDFDATNIVFMTDPSFAYIMSKNKYLKQVSFNFLQRKGSITDIVHDMEMKDFRISHNNEYLLVRSSRCLYLFDTKKNDLLHRLQKMPQGVFVEHLSTFKEAGFSQNDNMVVAARHTYLAVWDTVTAAPLRLLQTSVSPILKLYTSDIENKVITLLKDHSIQVWNLDNLEADVQHCNAVVRGKITSLDASINGKRIICGGPKAAEAVVVNLDSGKTERVLQHTNEVDVNIEQVLVSPSGRYAVTRIANSDIPEYLQKWDLLKEDKLWNLETGERMCGVVSNRFVAFSSNDSRVVFFPCRSYSTYDWNIVSYDTLIVDTSDRTNDYILELPEGDIVCQPILVDKAAYLVFILQQCERENKVNSSQESVSFKLYLCVYSFEKSWKGVNYVNTRDLWGKANEDDRFIDVRNSNDENVILVYGASTSHFPHRSDGSVDRSKHMAKGMLLYSLRSGCVLHHLQFFLRPNSDLSLSQISRKGTVLLDDKYQVFDILSGKIVNKLALENLVFKNCIKLLKDGKYLAIITANQRELAVYSASNGARKARIFMHGLASHLETCQDDKTLVVGCQDGRVAIFTLLLEYADHVVDVTRKLPSRQFTSSKCEVIEADIKQVQNSENEHRLNAVLSRRHIMDQRKKYGSFKALSTTVAIVTEQNRNKAIKSHTCTVQ